MKKFTIAVSVVKMICFGMENCEMCKHMAEHQDLMMNMKWE